MHFKETARPPVPCPFTEEMKGKGEAGANSPFAALFAFPSCRFFVCEKFLFYNPILEDSHCGCLNHEASCKLDDGPVMYLIAANTHVTF